MGIVGLCVENTTIDLHKARSLVDGYQQVRLLMEEEQDALQLFVQYAAIATAFWRYWKYNFYTPVPEKAKTHWQMAHLADEVAAIPEETFSKAIFH